MFCLEIITAYNELTKYSTQLSSASKKYEIAKFNYDKAKAMYELGMIPEKNVEAANIPFLQAEFDKKSAQMDLLLSQMKMNDRSGLGSGLK